MEHSYYLSVDGGGTKLHAILFDETLRPVAAGTGGSVNTTFEPLSLVSRSMEDSIEACLAPLGGSCRIRQVWISMPGPVELYERLLRKRCTVDAFTPLSEGETAAFGAGRRSGVVVLCGTGTTLYYLKDGRTTAVHGGWGSPFGDEGSGSDIGCMGIRAALRSLEGWGRKTMLEEEVRAFFGGEDMRESITNFYGRKDTRRAIASVCRVVSRCAEAGDLCARSILSEAGRKAARQAASFIREKQLPPDILVLAGGAWKSGEIMRRAFARMMGSAFPKAQIVLPFFDPVVGPVANLAMDGEGQLSPERRLFLEKNYPAFTCRGPGENTD